MIIRVIDVYKLMKRHAISDSVKTFQMIYRVMAIGRIRRKWHYMVIDAYDNIEWWEQDLFEVIDETIPEDWVSVKYKRFHKIKNNIYDFSITMSDYQGPKEFLENKNFLFDIYENNHSAYMVCYKYLKQKNYNRIKEIITAWDPVELISIHDFPEEHNEIIVKLSEELVHDFDVISIGRKIHDLYVEKFGLMTFGKNVQECEEVAKRILLPLLGRYTSKTEKADVQ